MLSSLPTGSLQQNLKAAPKPFAFALVIGALLNITACTPSVQVALPNEPININLNVKIQHEILIKIDKQLDNMFSESSGLF
ncbi:YnbE family lipoprotein [Thiomicrorhabdus sp. Milos-T2]|uniref:YnbE family lipoprotein n=1 Tax=Thiomicrorhabdus sp. Milos-T2 TaxID=90814 RepID=UPI0009FBA640|nr:YnbE family lipoprotein [Thiomicrorhabdus sp. Milos-T2]